MLTQIIVEGLFNLYNYRIDSLTQGGNKIHFLTSPNGYGKTTILEIIHAVVEKDFNTLLGIPFNKFSLFFENNGQVTKISVTKELVSKTQEPTTDLIEIPDVKLNITLHRIEDDKEIFLDSIVVHKNNSVIEITEGNGNIDMFLVSKTCHYLTDNRLIRKKTDKQKSSMSLDAIDLEEYASELKLILNDPTRFELYRERIELFKKIVERCEFASKEMEITKLFGFRFIADDEFKTKISLNCLSSGEKHMIIQLYELLFRAQEGTLVLIDEPELSLHMMWQINYLKNIEAIAKLRGFQCIVATHSPQIFNSMWSLTTDLFTTSNTDK